MWTARDSLDLYNIPAWGTGYFDVSPEGHLIVRPRRDGGASVDLFRLASEIGASGLSLPVLVRFTDILCDRIDLLTGAFDRACAALDYTGSYTAIYPIKVNQQRSVVEEIVHHGGARVGLEAGSKPELLAVLAMSAPGATIVCNGYKDREYLRLALIGRRLGHRVHVVIEKLSELDLLLEESQAMGIEPLLGVRVRLASVAAGKWQNTGGEKAKFGLSAAQALTMVERLRAVGRLDSLKLLHFHMGSQVANIRDIQTALREAARCYAELCRLGAPLEVADVGGGLGVDYEGTRSRSDCSANYGIGEYAHNVVEAFREMCDAEGLAHPRLMTESGRALTAHHAVLLVNVIDIERHAGFEPCEPPHAEDPWLLHTLWENHNDDTRPPLEAYHDAVHALSELNGMYTHGVLRLEQRARAERIYAAVCERVRATLSPARRAHRQVLDELNEKLADKYFLNFSVFQSIPDVWAIDQIFPVVPLHRLGERPERRAALGDLTCDSDGRIDHYVERDGVDATLALHEFRRGEPYVLGIFLSGAYQEILGDMHNLFGDTDSVNLRLDEAGGYRLEEPHRGDTVEDMLRYVHIDAEQLLGALRGKLEQARLTDAEREAHLAELAGGFGGYTYLEE